MSTWSKTWYEHRKKQNKYKNAQIIIYVTKKDNEYFSIISRDEYIELLEKFDEEQLELNVERIIFDSGREAKRFCDLLILQSAGEIENLSRQVEYVLIPSQKGETRNERKCSYFADFVYTDKKTGKVVVEDTKGMKTKDYIIKRKLMLYVHGIEIQEI